MSTVSEIEAALPSLSAEDLRYLEKAARLLREEKTGFTTASGAEKLRLFRQLQENLQLDEEKARAWIETIRDGWR